MAGTMLLETDTDFAHYQVWDMVYNGRAARVLYSGNAQAAQSGIPRDDHDEMLFDYNQRFYEIVSALMPTRILIIGGGAYTLPIRLISTLPTVKVDVVEIDEGLDEIAARFFDFKPDPRLHVVHSDGIKYLEGNSIAYDIIFIDAFSHTTIPAGFSTKWAPLAVKRNLTESGLVCMNVISAFTGHDSDVINEERTNYEAVFTTVGIYPATKHMSLWMPQNLILIAQNGKTKPIESYIGVKALR